MNALFRKIHFYVIITLFIHITAAAQDITGTWYEVSDSSRLFKVTISAENNVLKGTYDLSDPWQRLINAPIDSIRHTADSLILVFTRYGMKHIARFKKDPDRSIFEGEYTTPHFGPYNWRLSREPVDFKTESKSIIEPIIYDRQDSLRGSVTPERAWWDLNYYHLDIRVDVNNRRIKGSNLIRYRVLDPFTVLQVDLQPPLAITRVEKDGNSLDFDREGNAYFIHIPDIPERGSVDQIKVFYEGSPREAPNAPWDGGFSWSEDAEGKPFIATSCQGEGASLWWPNKDHMYDEADSMRISINVPMDLTAVANGRLINVERNKGRTRTYTWLVRNPINNYGVNVNIADYAHFSEEYQGEKGTLICDYYVLHENLEKARQQFKQVPLMLEAFEYWFGPYPFYEDGYKLVEVPYLGMEHQSSVTYGNGYENGFRGQDPSQSGWGLEFDYIIIHESGHEWFANNITYKDIADMWVHEGFTSYSEGIYLEYHFGKEAGYEYLRGIRRGIENEKPLIGDYEVNDLNLTRDIYPKGANILHTLRQIIDDDEKWRAILRGLNREFYHHTVTSRDIEEYIGRQSGKDLQPFFDQYLRTRYIPTLEYFFLEDQIVYRWINTIPEFDMPVKIKIDEVEKWIYPETRWTHEYMDIKDKELKMDPNFYAASMKTYEE